MKRHRIHGQGVSYQHLISRTIERRFIFGDGEKRKFRQIMRKLETFLGVEIVTYCLMSNHFHVFLKIPDLENSEPISPEELLERMPMLYSKDAISALKLKLASCNGSETGINQVMARYRQRMGKMDVFMKELKQRFSIWYNKRNGRRGPLWEDRYRSVLVEDHQNSLMAMAAYIDLNPVRAGMVEDPADYPFSGYGEAVGGNKSARDGLGLILEAALSCEGFSKQEPNWRRTGTRYRVLLYQHGEERNADEYTGRGGKAGFSREKVEAVVESKGKVSISTILRCRVRYFCDGAVFGRSDFVDSVFARTQEKLGLRREVGPRKMKGGVRWGDLRVMRDLRGESPL